MKKAIFLALLVSLFCACSPVQPNVPDVDATQIAVQATQQAQLKMSIKQTLTAIPTITPFQPVDGSPTPTMIPTPLFTPLPTPADPKETRTSEKDGMVLVFIPDGEFLMGSSKYDRDLETNEVPQHKVYLDAFWISKTQVTNTMYAVCVADGACQYSASHKTNPNYLDPAYANHPVVYISWQAALDYCTWAGGRLPSEAEWEKAARGPDGQKYAWGDTSPSVSQVNANNIISGTSPAGQYPDGASYYGVLDMGGNVREWVWDWYDPYYYQYSPGKNPMGPNSGEKKVLKGAGFSDMIRYVRPANRLAHDPTSPGNNRGFRCVFK
jgi:formylglycine-generating enzyme required for sulfatase activity